MTGILDADGTMAPGSGDAAGGDLIKDTDTARFGEDVIEASKSAPVVVDFWAEWCSPCKQLGPGIEKLVRENGGQVKLVKINVDENQELAQQMRVQSIPMAVAFKDGRPVDGFAGALPESQLRQFFDKLTDGAGSPLDQAVEQAEALLASGDAKTAQAIFSQILAQDGNNTAAHAGMIKCLRAAGEDEAAQEYISMLEPALQNDEAIKSLATAMELAAETATTSEETAALKVQLEASPDDPQLRFDYAQALYGDGQAEEAVDILVALVKTHKAWNDEAARMQLLKIFEALGHADPVTVEGRRKLSAVLFS